MPQSASGGRPYLAVKEPNHLPKYSSVPSVSGCHEKGSLAVLSGGGECLPTLRDSRIRLRGEVVVSVCCEFL